MGDDRDWSNGRIFGKIGWDDVPFGGVAAAEPERLPAASTVEATTATICLVFTVPLCDTTRPRL
jgi:hypothetical protein